MRFHSLFAFKDSFDPTWDYVSVTLWTEFEVGSGFVCASLPSLRSILLAWPWPSSRRARKPTPASSLSSRNSLAIQIHREQTHCWISGGYGVGQGETGKGSWGGRGNKLVSGGCGSPVEAKMDIWPIPEELEDESEGAGRSDEAWIETLPRIGCLPDRSFNQEDFDALKKSLGEV